MVKGKVKCRFCGKMNWTLNCECLEGSKAYKELLSDIIENSKNNKPLKKKEVK